VLGREAADIRERRGGGRNHLNRGAAYASWNFEV
jgi:hypothetical protein